jgi:hypothetical protein
MGREVLCSLRLGGARRSAYLRAVGDIDVERLQASLNRFTNRWLENVAPLIVDGEKGFLTNRRIMTVKWYLGYLGERDGRVTSRFVRRMRHPRDPRWSSVRQVLRGIRRRRRQRRRAIEDLDPRPGVSRFDGRPVGVRPAGDESIALAQPHRRGHGLLDRADANEGDAAVTPAVVQLSRSSSLGDRAASSAGRLAVAAFSDRGSQSSHRRSRDVSL